MDKCSCKAYPSKFLVQSVGGEGVGGGLLEQSPREHQFFLVRPSLIPLNLSLFIEVVANVVCATSFEEFNFDKDMHVL